MTHVKGKWYLSPERMLVGWRLMNGGKTFAQFDAYQTTDTPDEVFKRGEYVVNILNTAPELLEALRKICKNYHEFGLNSKIKDKFYKSIEASFQLLLDK